MKKIFTILTCICTISVNAQTPVERQTPNTSFGQRFKDKALVLNLGAGITSPSNVLKNEASLNNFANFNINAYLPILSYGGATGGVINFGLNAGGEYFGSNSSYQTGAYPSYTITGQTNAPLIEAKGIGSPKQQGFKFEAGAQANFLLGKITVSPILNAGFFTLKQKAFTITQTTSVNGNTSAYSLYSQPENKTSGFALTPKLRAGYVLGKLGFYVEGNYTAGPAINNQASTFKPNGAAQKDGSYSIDQMILGTNVIQTKSNKYTSVDATIGVTLYLSKKGYDSYKAHGGMTSAGTVNNPYSQSNGDQARRRVEVLKSNKTGDPNAKNITTNSSDPTNPTTTNAQQIAENPLYTGSTSTGTNPLFQGLAAGQPIGGIVVKGGKNPSPGTFRTTTNEKGEFELNNLEAGNYQFEFSMPETNTKRAARKVARKQAKQAKAKAIIENPIYTSTPSAGENPLFQGMVAGNPIGGIIVKGGKNPGGVLFTLMANGNSGITLTNLPAGNYKFTVTVPTAAEKSLPQIYIFKN